MKNIINIKSIKNFMEINNLTKIDFCRNANILIGDFNKLLIGNYDFDLIVLFKIAKYLNVEVYELFTSI